MISVYIPVYNSAAWAESFRLLPGFRYIASDNGSTDQTPDILAAKGVEVVRQPANLGRVGNWEFCVSHFVKSGAEWMKWLFAGDELSPDSPAVLARAIAENPGVSLIVGEYDISGANGTERWRMFPETRVISPAESMRQAAQRGNWFGSPIGCCVHRNAVVNGFDFGGMDWVSDMRFCLNIAEKHHVLYLAETLGTFSMAARKYYSANASDLFSRAEELLTRREAAAKYLKLTDDKLGFEEMTTALRQEFTVALVRNVSGNWGEYPALQDSVIESLPGKKMARALWHRLKGRVQGGAE